MVEMPSILCQQRSRRALTVLEMLVLIFGIITSGCSRDRESPAPAQPSAAQSKSTPVDINRADEKELMKLKGIGEVRANAIIRGRPYARKDELVQRGIVPLAVYEDIRDQIIARQK
jgi:competence protein ComEA